MDFSGRGARLYVQLGHGDGERRRATVEGYGTPTAVERLIGSRMQGFTSVARVERGDGFVQTPLGRIAIKAGDVLVMPAGDVVHGFYGPHRTETLALPVLIETGAVIRASELPRSLFELDDSRVLAHLQYAPHDRAIRRSTHETVLARAIRTIAHDPWTARLSRIAHGLGYTTDGLTALMHRWTGNGFARWRDALAMASSRDVLATAPTVAAAARELAVDPHYLHRRFALAHGTTPLRWRASPTLPPDAIAHHWDAIGRFLFGHASPATVVRGDVARH